MSAEREYRGELLPPGCSIRVDLENGRSFYTLPAPADSSLDDMREEEAEAEERAVARRDIAFAIALSALLAFLVLWGIVA